MIKKKIPTVKFIYPPKVSPKTHAVFSTRCRALNVRKQDVILALIEEYAEGENKPLDKAIVKRLAGMARYQGIAI